MAREKRRISPSEPVSQMNKSLDALNLILKYNPVVFWSIGSNIKKDHSKII